MIEREIQLPNARLFCRIGGEGPPILFVHGFPISGEMWLPVAESVSGEYRCIVPDLRGHGRSEVSSVISIAEFADDLSSLLDALDETRPVALLGLSMGGIIAFEFFRRHRDRVASLGLINTRANAENPDGIERRRKMAEAALRQGTGAIVDLMINNLFGPDFPRDRRDDWRRRMSETPALGAAAAAMALAGRRESLSTLAEIDVPTLVVGGDRDTITPVETLREIHAGIRGSRFEVFEGCGHVPPIEFPERFARVLAKFLRGSGM